MNLPFRSLAMFGATVLAACSTAPSTPSNAEAEALAKQMLKSSFSTYRSANVDRLQQDESQALCSQPGTPDAAVAKRLEAAALAKVQWPANGQYLGDWREGEKLAQNGRGMTWSDPVGSANGGNCYNCHQISKAEISFGTIGPSLYHYGRLRGVANPADPASAEIVRYTWGKIWNAKAYNVCSEMPRFGHGGLLKEQQMRDLMALLLDPKSPVNQP